VNEETSFTIRRRYRDAVRRKRPEKWKASAWLLVHDNVSALWWFVFKDFLAKSHVTTMECLSYIPNLVPADFNLLSRQTAARKGRCFVMLTSALRMQRKS
jgi:hypothetical protein